MTPQVKQDNDADPELDDAGNADDEKAETEEQENQTAVIEKYVARPVKQMDRMLLAHCTLETMPGLVLQAVFWVRSFNDARLAEEGNALVVFSILASLLSVTSRYV